MVSNEEQWKGPGRRERFVTRNGVMADIFFREFEIYKRIATRPYRWKPSTSFFIPFPLWSSFFKWKKFDGFAKILISYVFNIREDEDGLGVVWDGVGVANVIIYMILLLQISGTLPSLIDEFGFRWLEWGRTVKRERSDTERRLQQEGEVDEVAKVRGNKKQC